MENQGLASSVSPPQQHYSDLSGLGNVLTLGLVKSDPGYGGAIAGGIFIVIIWPLIIGILVGMVKHSTRKGLLASLITFIVLLLTPTIVGKYDDLRNS